MPTTQIKDISTGKLERREQDLLPLSPLVRLLWSSIIDELTTTYDDRPGRTAQEKGCKPVLLLIDEGGRTAIPKLLGNCATQLFYRPMISPPPAILRSA